MRHLSETFTDDQFEQLKRVKGNRSWREAILDEFNVTLQEEPP